MDFAYSDEQRMLVDTVRAFVAKELMPYEAEVERDNQVPPRADRGDPRARPRPPGSMPPTCRRISAAAGSTRSASP